MGLLEPQLQQSCKRRRVPLNIVASSVCKLFLGDGTFPYPCLYNYKVSDPSGKSEKENLTVS